MTPPTRTCAPGDAREGHAPGRPADLGQARFWSPLPINAARLHRRSAGHAGSVLSVARRVRVVTATDRVRVDNATLVVLEGDLAAAKVRHDLLGPLGGCGFRRC